MLDCLCGVDFLPVLNVCFTYIHPLQIPLSLYLSVSHFTDGASCTTILFETAPSGACVATAR